MEELGSIFGSLSRLMGIVGGGISTVAVCYAGILWMTSSGDPQNMSKARMALMGAVGGLVIVGIAFVIPRIIGGTVIEPVGGNIGGTESSQNCDEILRNQFIFQRNAANVDRLNGVVANVQTQRPVRCSLDVWAPVVADAADVFGTTPNAGCKGSDVGGQDVPSGLHEEGSVNEDGRYSSGRDRDNNIIIQWEHGHRPTDNAKCWLYVERLSVWSVE